MPSNFDERCPRCGEKIVVYDHFVADDYDTFFDFDCPKCEQPIHVTVHAIPKFELHEGRPRNYGPSLTEATKQ
jgi:hypothetical protein